MSIDRDGASAISAHALTKTYGRLVAVGGLDLDVRRGEIFGFLGPNGAGKSTTIRMLCGLVRPTSGTATVAGHDVVADPVEVKRRVGYMPEKPFLYPKLTGRELLHFVAELHQVDADKARERIERLLRMFSLTDKADTVVDSYSHGMRQKLALGTAMVHAPRILFLDEPTSGMDPRSARHVKDLLVSLAERGRTVFLSTHVLEIAERMCHRVGIVDRGRLVALGSLDELRASADHSTGSLEDVFLRLTSEAHRTTPEPY